MTDLRIGLASACITPDEPVWLHGYLTPERAHPHQGVLHDLYARAMAFEDAAGQRALLVTLDLCVLRTPEARVAVERISEASGVPADRIVMNHSHTHSGPIVGESELYRFDMTDIERKRTRTYTATLYERLAEAAAAAASDLQPARLSWGRGEVGFVRNRRRFDENGMYAGMGPNPDGFADPRVTVLRVEAPGGDVRAVLFSLACHAVTLGKTNLMISSDYPGPARDRIEAEFPGAMALFVQGCGADANPEPRATPDQVEWTTRHGEELAAEVVRVAKDTMAPISAELHVARTMTDLPLRELTRDQMGELAGGPSHLAFNAQRLLALLEKGGTPPSAFRVPIGLWRIGEDFTFVSLPNEVVAGYVPLIEKALDTDRVLVAGYCNEVSGYLPTAEVLAEGGYETKGVVSNSVIGYYDPAVQDTILNTIKRLAEQVAH